MEPQNFNSLKTSLASLGYTVKCFESSLEAADYLSCEINGKNVGFGGSVTLEEMGLYGNLSTHNQVFWHQGISSKEASDEMRKKAASADIYISSVNAIAESGEIINIDGNCNRVSSILYGHKKVYLIIGKNKITNDYDSALFRARNIAAPLNAKRLGMKTPCAKNADRCYNCKSPERICKSICVLLEKPLTGEFEIVLINENLGY